MENKTKEHIVRPFPEVPEVAPPVRDPETVVDSRTGQPRSKHYISVIRAEKWWVEKAREDPAFYIEYVSGDAPAAHHRIWLANIFHPKRKRVNLIGPRESAKTTIGAYALSWIMGVSPLLTHCIMSVSAKQSEDRLRMIRSVISDNSRFRNVFPWIQVDYQQPSTQSEFSLLSQKNGIPYKTWRTYVSRYGSLKDPTLVVAGAGGKGIIGRRFSGLLWLDDIVDESYLSDAMQVKMLQYIMQTLIPCVQEEGRVLNIGTRWMIGDIYERLMNNPAWKSVVIPAILYRDNVEYSYWPEYWSLKKLADKKLEMDNDALFKIMYLCDPKGMAISYFTRENMQRDLPTDDDYTLAEVYITTDVAISMKERADFNVAYAVGITTDGRELILDGIRYKASVEDSVGLIAEFADNMAEIHKKLTLVLFENVAFQAAIMQLISSRRPDLPIGSVVPKGDKGHRAKVVADRLQQKKLFINQRISFLPQIFSEWMNFGTHPHDDTLDPISNLYQYLGISSYTSTLKVAKSIHFL